jgi:coenzyme F420-reducing hydrogenase alpha subunit
MADEIDLGNGVTYRYIGGVLGVYSDHKLKIDIVGVGHPNWEKETRDTILQRLNELLDLAKQLEEKTLNFVCLSSTDTSYLLTTPRAQVKELEDLIAQVKALKPYKYADALLEQIGLEKNKSSDVT